MNLFAQFVTLSLAFLSVNAVNNFGGIVASNSASTGSYTCRTQQQWNDLANTARNNGFSSIRVLSVEPGCDALNRAATAAASAGLTVLAGIWVDGTMAQSAANIQRDAALFRDAVRRFGAGRFRGLTVGNEVNDSPANIINKVNEVRNFLRSNGVNTPVSTVHTWVHIRDNRVLCNGDFVGANAHAFFDGNVVGQQTGDFVFKTVVPSLKGACPGKQLWITESGWPSRGPSRGRAVASVAEARTALLNLNCACRDDRSVSVYAFEADDSLWKPGNDNERSFGIFGKHNLGEVFAPC